MLNNIRMSRNFQLVMAILQTFSTYLLIVHIINLIIHNISSYYNTVKFVLFV